VVKWLGPIQISAEYGVQFERLTDDGRIAQVSLLLFGAGSISIGPAGSQFYNETYSYETYSTAVLALAGWDIETEAEPSEWIRHLPTGRRRPNGDPTQEYIAE
jgi:hypothetical protein